MQCVDDPGKVDGRPNVRLLNSVIFHRITASNAIFLAAVPPRDTKTFQVNSSLTVARASFYIILARGTFDVYRKNAITATAAPTMAVAPAKLVAAPPVNGLTVGVGGVTVVVLVPFVVELLLSTKLAHVKRVVLEEWTTRERLPKKEPRPAAEDT